jgi:DNA polymerase-3 subunit alpha
VLVKASAAWEADELKLRAASVQDLDNAAADAGEGLLIQLDRADALGTIASHLRAPGKGIVRFVVPGGPGEEVEIELPKRQQITPALKGAIKSLPGVAAVESL